MQPPSALGLILCHRVIIDRETGERTIVGSFDALRCQSVPFEAPPIVAYAALTDGLGRVNLEMRVTDVDGEDQLALVRLAINFPDPFAIAHVRFRFSDLSFPNEGQYLFELFANQLSL